MRNVARPADIGRVLGAVALLVAVLLAFSAAAHAQRGSGLYLAADLGMALSSSSDFNAATRGKADFDSALGYSAAVGFGWDALRMEGEISWRDTDVDSIEYSRFSVGGQELSQEVVNTINSEVELTGSRATLGLMTNAWYDVDVGMGFTPYFGGGLGVQYVRYEIDRPRDLSSFEPDVVRAARTIGGDDGDWVLAYQVGGGVAYRLMESLVVQVGYRYMGAGDPKLSSLSDSSAKSDAGNHVFRAGIRIGF